MSLENGKKPLLGGFRVSWKWRSAKKRDWGTLTGIWVPHEERDQIVDFVRRWSEKTETLQPLLKSSDKYMMRNTMRGPTIVLLLSVLSVSTLAQRPPFVPVTDRMLEQPDAADWLTWRRTPNGWGYSPLKQIDRSNVRSLRLEWTRAMRPGLQEAVPLAYGGFFFPSQPARRKPAGGAEKN